MLQIYNSLTQEKHDLKPIKEGEVGIYVCGMTVYDHCHIGHARSLITFDVIVKYLRYSGYRVNFVRNITDIDDKIIRRAHENKESCDVLTARFIESMHQDEAALNITSPDHEPRATEYLPQIIKLIQTLLDRSHAYVADSGDVLFAIDRFESYGKLSRRDVDKLIAGARVDIGEAKDNPLDFVLWKKAKPDEPQWDSPWGAGRPGWHIECSAMATDLLGQPFDIHGAGLDLKFPHNENEIAQSEASCGCQFANCWMHVGLLQIDREKMSKSLGNFITIKEALQQYHPEVLRYFMLSGHYRSPVNYSEDTLQQINQALTGLYTAIYDLPLVDPEGSALVISYEVAFKEAMDDDFNTPKALSVLFEMAKHINRIRDPDVQTAAQLALSLKSLAAILGIVQDDAPSFLQRGFSDEQQVEIKRLIVLRNDARVAKDWAEADRVRDSLLAMGVELEDGPDGTLWHKI